MLVGSIAFVAPSAEAKSTDSRSSLNVETNHVQVRNGYRVRPNGRVVRVATRSRLVRVGRRLYRETYQIRVLPNGRATTRLISRVRVR